MNKEEAIKIVEKHGSIRGAARSMGVPESTLRGWVKGQRAESKKNTSTKFKPKKKTLSDFRATYDKSYVVPKKIKAALSSLGGGWEYEVDFAKQAGITLSDLGMFRDQFNEHIVQVKEGRKIWAGTKSLASQMREMI